ncbi:MAG: radical SAM protein [Candidatus Omnitrophota bacterium]
MKILFVVPQLDFADHIAVAYLSAMAKQLRHSTYFCILSEHSFLEEVSKIKPDIIAYSVNVMGFGQIVENHKRAKQKHHFVSIMGGPQATFSPDTFDQSEMDAYCVGEGEYAFRDFLIKVENGESFDEVANLITKKGKNGVRPLIRNLDELPPADRDLTISNSFLKNVPKKTFYATRGCPYRCAYCCNSYYQELYKGKGPIVRRFSVERLIREIEAVKRQYRMDFVKFGDDLFAMKADSWLEEFTDKYSKRIGVPFNCFLRFDLVDEGLLKLLKNAGCFSVHLSVDSTSDHVREKILARQMRKVNIAEKLKMITDYGINTWVNFMLAVPESSLQDDLDTIELCRKAKVTYPSYSVTVPMEGTGLYRYCMEKGLIASSSYVGDMEGCSLRPTLPCFSEKEKDIRYNVYLVGALITKFPFPINKIAIWVIKVFPPNKLFKKIRSFLYEYYISNKIFKLRKEI